MNRITVRLNNGAVIAFKNAIANRDTDGLIVSGIRIDYDKEIDAFFPYTSFWYVQKEKNEETE